MNIKEQYRLVKKIQNDLCGIFDEIFDEFYQDPETLKAMDSVEKNLGLLEDEYEENIDTPCTSYKNCFILRSKEDGEIIIKSYDDDNADVMMRDVSKIICFSDCDDTWDIIKIVYLGREVEYTGWQPGMVMSYEFAGTHDEAWSGVFENWDHQS